MREIILKGWEMKSLGEIAPLQRGFDLPTSQLIKGIYPVVYSNGILNFHNKYQAKAPGVVTGRSGTIGKVTFVEANYWPHNTSLWVTDFKNNFAKFIYYLYVFIGFERFGTGSGVPTLNRNDVHSFKISISTKIEEQKAIAQSLSNVDALITECDRIITKKRNTKQSTMQQLLTGKKRLPGFSGEWKVEELGNIALLERGKFSARPRNDPKFFGGDILFIHRSYAVGLRE